MLRKAICSSIRLGTTGKHARTRNIISFVLKRSSTTEAATKSISEECDRAKSYEEVPGPKPMPIFGNIWRFLPYIGELSTEFTVQQDQLHKSYGIIVKVSGLPGRRDMVLLYDPDDIEKVYRNEGPWPSRDSLQSMTYYRKVHRKDLFEGVGGAVVSQGIDWQKFRTKVNQIMMQPRATKIYIGPIDAVAEDFIARIRKLRNEKLEVPPNFANELCKWGLESIVYIALDKRMGCLADNLKPDSEPQKMIDAIQDVFDAMYILDLRLSPWKIISTPTWRKFVRASDFFTDLCIKYINEAAKRLSSLPEDSERELTVLEKLLARDPDPKTAMVMALDMMTAGVDTTSFSTAVALYFLAKNPDKQEKLFQEINHFLPDKKQPVTSEILNELKYLKACIKESMRLKPIAIGNVRTLTNDLVLSGYRIPKGVDAVFPNMHLCQLEKYFPEPDKFIPERWLKSGDGERPAAKMAHPFVFMPFGFGPRMCLGRRFAELEMETLLTKIIRNFHLEYNYGEVKFQSKLLYIPVSPLQFKFVDRD